jgi:hypothetical protein
MMFAIGTGKAVSNLQQKSNSLELQRLELILFELNLNWRLQMCGSTVTMLLKCIGIG